MSKLLSISPLTGRYKDKIEELEKYTSEYALIKKRVEVEIIYLFELSKLKLVDLSKVEKKKLLNLISNFDLKDAEKIKKVEEKTKHDVKAIELYLRPFLSGKNREMLHFGLTSEDINNIAYRLMLHDASQQIIIPTVEKLLKILSSFSDKNKNIPMLARTHGQPAIPTTVGKEFAVFANRLNIELKKLDNVQFTGKLNGAVGNYNALHFAYPKIDWVKFSKTFIQTFKLKPNLITTQINSFEDVIEYFQVIQRLNGILLDLDQDLWRYISDGWISLKSEDGQVGSSTLPQKINPIDFENSEGNLELANGLIEVFIRKLAVSRLQRDLSNSTIIRNIGTVLGYSLLAYKSTLSGLSKIGINKDQIAKDLNEDWSILAEAAQITLRGQKVKNSYFKVLELIRGRKMNQKDWQEFVKRLPLDNKSKEKLLSLTTSTYLGLVKKLTY